MDEPIYHGGKMVGIIRKYSDTLLIFLLKSFRPEKCPGRLGTEIHGRKTDPVEIRWISEIEERPIGGRRRAAEMRDNESSNERD